MSVVGIDFGNDNCYISVARAGGIETVANDYSLRDTPSVVSFSDRQRIIGVAAKSQILTNLKRTFFNFKGLIGRKFSDPVVQETIKGLPFGVSEAPNGGVLVHARYNNKEQTFSPEQLTAMLFTKLKETAETALQTKVKDVVISVPAYFTDAQRRTMLDAAAVAGLNVLKLMNDTTATALAYGIYKQDLPAPEEKARNVVFVDCGHKGLQVAACSFNKGKLTVRSCGFDLEVGGQYFTEEMAKVFIDDFKSRYKIDVNTSPRAYLKLVTELDKLKKQMSANTNRLPLNIECFMDDKDVTGGMDRAKFEELIEPYLKRAEQVFTEVLSTCKWKKEDIYSIEVVGGSSRVPAIKALIEKVFGKPANTTLNADEAVSRGCALQCAILSPTFRVREFSVTDLQPYPINLIWQAESDSGDMEVFPRFHAVPFSKILTFYRREPFFVSSEYGAGVPVPDPKIGTFEIGEVKPTADGGNQKVKVKVRVNLNGIFTVSSANIVEKYEVEEEVPMEVDPPKETEDAKKEGENKEGEKDKAPEATDAEMKDESKPDEPKQPPKMEKRKKTVSKTVDLPVSSRVVGALTPERLDEAVAFERQMAFNDRQEAERLHAKNAVEEYIYDIRSRIYEELEAFISEEDRAKLGLALEDGENWLYEDGEDCEKKVYEEKLKEFKMKGEPIKKRKQEFDERPAAIDALGRTLQQAGKAVEAFKAGDEKYDHLDAASMEKVQKQIEEKLQWLNTSCSTLQSVPKTQNPPILAVQFLNEKQAFESIVNPILNKPKPKVEPPPKEEPKESKAKEESAAPTTTEQPEVPPVNGEAQQNNMDLD